MRFFARLLLVCICAANEPAAAQVSAPKYEECLLAGIFPAGGRQGDRVAVELLGGNNANLTDVREIIVDGAPGVTVHEVKNSSPNAVQATFVIAPDAEPGRRYVRVLSERSGLTNMVFFTVGRLPEAREHEPNNDRESAELISLPVVLNGRVNPKADIDCFSFALEQGQRITAAVLSHALDSHGQGSNYGIADANLEILDERGRVVAEANDTLGLDPLVEFTAPHRGRYLARVWLEAYEGFPQAVYRLILGDVALPTSVFPPGGQRGQTVDLEFAGPGLPPGLRRQVAISEDISLPFELASCDLPAAADFPLPLMRGEWPERVEAEPNQEIETATPIVAPMTANGRIDQRGDVDLYRITLAAGQSICLETVAQRFLRSPIDTRIEVLDATSKTLAENDDGFPLDYVSMHDFRPTDSRLTFTAPAAGEYYVRVGDQSGGEGGPRAVYRLTVTAATPTFELYLYPDGTPIWGPRTTAALLVKVNRFDQMNGEIELRMEGLPEGWITSRAISRGSDAQPPQTPSLYYFLTITAPPNAKIGETHPFRVVGRAEINGRMVERTATPLTLYYTSDTGFFRITPQARVAVARPQTPWLSAMTDAITAKAGDTAEIPVQVHGLETIDKLDLTADLATSGVATAMDTPKSVSLNNGKAILPVKLGENLRPGRYGIVVSLRWRSDIRIGMPGPCTQLIALTVLP